MEQVEIRLVVLLTVAAAVAIVSHRIDMPYAILLVLAERALGSVHAYTTMSIERSVPNP